MLTPAEIAELRHAVQFKQRPVDGAPRIGETRGTAQQKESQFAQANGGHLG